jgi:hypothetical protein
MSILRIFQFMSDKFCVLTKIKENSTNNSIRFNFLFICLLSSVAGGQLQSQHQYKQKQDNTGQKKQRKSYQLRFFIFKSEFLKISVAGHSSRAV